MTRTYYGDPLSLEGFDYMLSYWEFGTIYCEGRVDIYTLFMRNGQECVVQGVSYI